MTRKPFTRGRRHHRSAISPYFFAPPSSTYRPPQTKPPCDEDRGQTTSTYPTSISPSYSTCPKNAPMTMDRKRNVLYVMATSMSWSQIQLEGPCNPTETHPEGDANAQSVQTCSKEPHAKGEFRPVISYHLMHNVIAIAIYRHPCKSQVLTRQRVTCQVPSVAKGRREQLTCPSVRHQSRSRSIQPDLAV